MIVVKQMFAKKRKDSHMNRRTILQEDITELKNRQRALASLAPFYMEKTDLEAIQAWVSEREAVEMEIEAKLAEMELLSSSERTAKCE